MDSDKWERENMLVTNISYCYHNVLHLSKGELQFWINLLISSNPSIKTNLKFCLLVKVWNKKIFLERVTQARLSFGYQKATKNFSV